MQNDLKQGSHKKCSARRKGVSSNAAPRTPLPLRSFANMDHFPPLTVRWLSQPTLSDNAALVPTPLYDMSSLDSSIDRQKDIVEMRR